MRPVQVNLPHSNKHQKAMPKCIKLQKNEVVKATFAVVYTTTYAEQFTISVIHSTIKVVRERI
ncbi:hypothetical protein AERO9A_370287 [Aeromonas salmonicida]|nr:hypothetical protein AERO9A_370287 [Aeromonas salmonicida]